ncbi:MAG: LacI family DNA-binding transcriptional regulator [Clostridia bacterium]|nr:LacI family DNA-binding transcriptional regulator [Clostridia bacterium]
MTLKDVALKAECSVSTVSKALKNSSEISEDAKQRILAVAKECGYFKKASTRASVLGGFKTVIFNDVKGDSITLFADFQKLAKKSGLTAIYVSISEKDSLELLNQLGAFGLVLKGGSQKSAGEKVFALKGSFDEANEFLKEISLYMPERPSRAVTSKEGQKAATKNKAKKVTNADEKKAPERAKKEKPAPQKKEEIWLL